MDIEEIRQVRIEKLNKLKALGVDPYGARFSPLTPIARLLAEFEEGRPARAAGRIMASRSHGKVIFLDLMDMTGKIQVFVKADILGDDGFAKVQALDIGDIIGVEGELFRTKTGQESIRLSEVTVLSKSLRALPEKWHGLKDTEIRYRQRYLDLIANPGVREVFRTRTKILTLIRSFLDQAGFLEVETPMLQPMAGGARGRPFQCRHNAYDRDVYLRIAPELYLKRLLVGGLERVYELNRNFRNEGISTRHNPEFTMLEVYQAYGDYEDMMDLMERLVVHVVENIHGKLKIDYQGRTIDFTPPWPRRSFADLVKERFDIRPEDNADEMLRKVKAVKGERVTIDKLTRSAVMKIVEDELEDMDLTQPVFFTDYFTFLSPLAKVDPSRPGIAQRFEVFIGGLEVGNAYSELNDPLEQRDRLESDLSDDVETGNRSLDEDFLQALEYGMPPAGGLGVGIDRLVMLLTDSPSIRDVILFPLLRPLEDSTRDLPASEADSQASFKDGA